MIPEETPAVQNITPVETPAVPETPAAPVDEQQYEYVEVPADQVPADAQQYEYVEVPADQVPADAQQYEYVEVPADQVPADAQQYEYVEVPADQVPADAQQYEYVEVPADQAVQDFGVEKLDELGETSTVENVTPAETVAEPETVAPPAETYDFASLEMPETAAPVVPDAPAATVENITPVETIPEPDVAAPVETVAEPEMVAPPATATVENITPVEAITEPDVAVPDAPPAAAEVAVPAAPAATLQETLETPETETVIDGGAQSLTPEDKIYSAEELETPEVENITPVETVAEPEMAAPVETIPEPDVTAVPAAPAAAQIAEETQEELDPPEISDTLSAPAPDVEAAAMQETADMTQQAETAQEVLAGETAEVENVSPAETVAEPETDTPAETVTEPETVAPPAAAEVAVPTEVAPDAPAAAVTEPETVAPPAAAVAPDAPAAVEGFVFKDGDGQKSFTAENAAQSVTIDTADLSRWMIVLNQISVSPVEAAAGQQIELSPDMYCQGQLIGATGDVMPFANMANVPVPEFSPDPVQSATLFFSGVSIIPLANQGGVTMDLGGANGVVVNTNGDMLYFANLSALTLIETPAPVAETPETTAPATTNAPDVPPAPVAPAATIPAYAFAPVPAPLNDAVVFSADSESAQVDGNDGKPHILVKANDRLLGWHVDFAAAGRMSLADVKAYQAAHGDLPEHDGVLTFKDKSLTFKNILSIRVFETPAYCGYGIAPTV